MALFALLFLGATAAHAADALSAGTFKKLDAYFDALQGQGLANGSIAISERGEVKYRRAVGFTKLTPPIGEPADPGTRYKIGSVTKLFTAVLTLQLAEKASITLDSKLAEFYPDLPNALDITYRDLLMHRSGLADYSKADGFEEWRRQPRSHAELLEIIGAGGARFAPRARVEYSNSNYLLLGFILEKIYEKPYPQIVRQQVIDKLGLGRTLYGVPPDGESPVSYEFTPGGWVADEPTDPGIHGGAGGLLSNPANLVRFMDALAGGRLLSAHSLASMRDQAGGSGMGLWPYRIAGQGGFGHGGAIEAFRSCVIHFPDRKISVAYTTNAPVLAMSEIVDEAMALVFDAKRKPPTFVPQTLTEAQQKPVTGTWRSASGTPTRMTFRDFRPPDSPLVLDVLARPGGPVVSLQGAELPLVAYGGGEFLVPKTGYLLRFDGDELVVRGPDYAYFLRRDVTPAG